jgi:hypothetical protein
VLPKRYFAKVSIDMLAVVEISLSIRVILIFFVPGVCRVCARCAPGVHQAWRRWLSVFQLGVLKLAGKVAEWILQYSSNH